MDATIFIVCILCVSHIGAFVLGLVAGDRRK